MNIITCATLLAVNHPSVAADKRSILFLIFIYYYHLLLLFIQVHICNLYWTFNHWSCYSIQVQQFRISTEKSQIKFIHLLEYYISLIEMSEISNHLLKAIRFVNSVCTIFILRKQDTPHQTVPRQPELTSAVSLRKQGTCSINDILIFVNDNIHFRDKKLQTRSYGIRETTYLMNSI